MPTAILPVIKVVAVGRSVAVVPAESEAACVDVVELTVGEVVAVVKPDLFKEHLIPKADKTNITNKIMTIGNFLFV